MKKMKKEREGKKKKVAMKKMKKERERKEKKGRVETVYK